MVESRMLQLSFIKLSFDGCDFLFLLGKYSCSSVLVGLKYNIRNITLLYLSVTVINHLFFISQGANFLILAWSTNYKSYFSILNSYLALSVFNVELKNAES